MNNMQETSKENEDVKLMPSVSNMYLPRHHELPTLWMEVRWCGYLQILKQLEVVTPGKYVNDSNELQMIALGLPISKK